MHGRRACGIQAGLAFGIRGAFAFRARAVAGRTLAAGRTIGTRTFAGSIATGLVATFAVARAVRISGTFAITRAAGFGTHAVAGSVATGFVAAFPVARSIRSVATPGLGIWATFRTRTVARAVAARLVTAFPIARAVWIAGAFAIAGTTLRWRKTPARPAAFARPILRSAGRARAIAAHSHSHSLWRRAEQCLDREFAAVLARKVAERFRGVVNFLFGDDAVMIPVEHGDDGREVRQALHVSARAGAFARRRSRRTAFRLLCVREARGKRERERDDGCVVFHGLVWSGWLCAVCLKPPGETAMKKGVRRLGRTDASLKDITFPSLSPCVRFGGKL